MTRAGRDGVGRRRWRWLAVATCLVALSAADVSAAARRVVRVSHWGGGDAARLFEEYVAEFERQHPDIDVQPEPYPENYTEQLLVRFAAGTAPDVMLLDNPYVPTFVDQGLIEDLRPYVQRGLVDLSSYFEPALAIFTRQGRVYGLPKGFTPIVMYYNKVHFDEAGLSYPRRGWTFNDYLDEARKLVRWEGGKVQRWGTYFTNWMGYTTPLVWSYGGEFLSPDWQTALGYTNSPVTVEAVQFLLDLALKHRVAPTQAEMDALGGGLFSKGLAGLAVSGHWSMFGFAPLIKQGQLSVGVVDLPQGPNRTQPSTVIYATAWGITSQARDKEAALELVKFLAGAWVQERENLGNYIEIPGRKDVARKVQAADPFGVEQAFLEAAQYGRPPYGSVVPNYQQIEAILTDAIGQAWTGGANLRNTLESAARQISALLAEGRRR